VQPKTSIFRKEDDRVMIDEEDKEDMFGVSDLHMSISVPKWTAIDSRFPQHLYLKGSTLVQERSDLKFIKKIKK
jgi:hypothetical protein